MQFAFGRMTVSKGPVEEVSLLPTRMRKDLSTVNEGIDKAQGQVQANVQSQQRTADTPRCLLDQGHGQAPAPCPPAKQGCSWCPAIHLHGPTAAQVSRHQNQHHHTHHHRHL